ncbi:MAG TPA: Do family serine endopeptidase [Burkholderiales bacterium]|nr:Do family serine endopeptidase [Burkholderiales bacterium]
MMNKKLILALVAAISVSTTSFAATIPNSSASGVVSAYPDFSAIYDNVGKSVVNINVTQNVTPQGGQFGSTGDPMFDYFFKRMVPQQQQKYKQRGLGSGFILSSDGYILTNAHVVNNADSVTVKLSDKREFKAKVVGVDMTSDVAVIKIAAKNLPSVKIGNPNNLKAGNWVVAIGSPFGLENTITQGIVSALSRSLPDDSAVPYIQTDVPINPGNSGGPLINLNGEVVGINSQIYSKSGGYMGISFSIPIDYAMRVADQLKSTGKVVHGRLGIAIQPVTEELASSFGLSSAKGALVNGVDAGSAAEKAGIEVGDVILKANGQEISDTSKLPQIVSNLGPNKPVNLVIWRNNQQINLTATTMASDENGTSSPSNNGNNSNNVSSKQITKLGIAVAQLNAKQLQQLGLKLNSALVIQSVNGDAQFAGLASGDIILGIANTPVSSLDQFVKIVDRYKNGQTIVLKILRTDSQRTITMFLPFTIGGQNIN